MLRAVTVPTKVLAKKPKEKGLLSEMKSNMQQIDAEINELNKQLRK